MTSVSCPTMACTGTTRVGSSFAALSCWGSWARSLYPLGILYLLPFPRERERGVMVLRVLVAPLVGFRQCVTQRDEIPLTGDPLADRKPKQADVSLLQHLHEFRNACHSTFPFHFGGSWSSGLDGSSADESALICFLENLISFSTCRS